MITSIWCVFGFLLPCFAKETLSEVCYEKYTWPLMASVRAHPSRAAGAVGLAWLDVALALGQALLTERFPVSSEITGRLYLERIGS